jgi:transcription termination factor NusB
MPGIAKKPRRKRRSNAAERLFQAAFGRKMTAKERKKFIIEEPATLEELAKRSLQVDFQDFLSQT